MFHLSGGSKRLGSSFKVDSQANKNSKLVRPYINERYRSLTCTRYLQADTTKCSKWEIPRIRNPFKRCPIHLESMCQSKHSSSLTRRCISIITGLFRGPRAGETSSEGCCLRSMSRVSCRLMIRMNLVVSHKARNIDKFYLLLYH